MALRGTSVNCPTNTEMGNCYMEGIKNNEMFQLVNSL